MPRWRGPADLLGNGKDLALDRELAGIEALGHEGGIYRHEKSLGVGQAQLWNPTAVPKQPALVVAAYSALLLAALKVFGAERGLGYAQLPEWRRKASRPSCLDLITLVRKEASEHPELIADLDFQSDSPHFVAAAAAAA